MMAFTVGSHTAVCESQWEQRVNWFLSMMVTMLNSLSLSLSLVPPQGVDLENIVYYKDDTHYFVMTAKKQSLLEKGVILHVGDPLLAFHRLSFPL